MTAQRAGIWTVGIAFVCFIGLGLVSGLLGVAWPSMQAKFSRGIDEVGVLNLISTTAYTLAGFYIGRMMGRFGSGTTLLTAAVMVVLSLFAYVAAPSWEFILAAGFLNGLGTGVLDAGLNFYIAAHHSARSMNWLHACFGIGTTISPLIMTNVLDNKLGWEPGYAIVGALMLIIVGLMFAARRLWRAEGFQAADNTPMQRVSYWDTLRLPAVWFSLLTYFFYVGLELGVGLWAYTILTEARGVDTVTAGTLVSVYWGTFTVGRIAFGIFADRLAGPQVLRVCLLGAIAGAVLFLWNPSNEISYIGLAVLGVAQAPFFPLFMSGTRDRVGAEHAGNTIGMQMSAVGLGVAILPGIAGVIAKQIGDVEFIVLFFLGLAVLTFIFHEFTLLRRPAPVSAQPTARVGN